MVAAPFMRIVYAYSPLILYVACDLSCEKEKKKEIEKTTQAVKATPHIN
jgi:hypothetical protein